MTITRADLIAAIEATEDSRGLLIEAGKPGTQDYDTGRAVYDRDTDTIEVAWVGGACRTTLAVDEYTRIVS